MTKCKNLFFAFIGPSGAGKSTLITKLQKHSSEKLALLITATTRTIRDGEVDGVHHYFISKKEFNALIKNDEFLEHSTTHGISYGTLKQGFEEQLQKTHLLKDLDWVGAKNFKNIMPNKTFNILILPPNRKILEQRLKARDKSDISRISTIDNTAHDILAANEPNKKFVSDDLKGSCVSDYDLVIFNKNLEHTVSFINNFILMTLAEIETKQIRKKIKDDCKSS